MTSFGAWLDRWAVERSDHPAIIESSPDGDHITVTYGDLHRQVVEAAKALAAQGVAPGHRVVWLGENRISFLVQFLACSRLGAIFTPLNTRLTAAEQTAQVTWAAPAVVDGDVSATDRVVELRAAAANAPTVDAASAIDASDPALLVYTSGTTGRPKGAVHTHRSLNAVVDMGVATQGLTATDIGLAFLPLFHVGGLNIQVIPLLAVGATVVLQRRFDPGLVLADIARHRPTISLFVPATMRATFAHPDWPGADLSCFRGIQTGSSIVPHDMLTTFLVAGVPAGQVYGSTETGPTTIVLTFDEAERVGSCGCAAPGSEARLGPDAEIQVAGPHLFCGYWNDPQATAEAFDGRWYRTGDVGHCDAEGFFTVDDRLGDLIISGGENVYPAEVEEVLATAPGVAEITVVGQAHEQWGEVPVAVVVPADAADPHGVDLEALRAHGEHRLARYKLPQAVVTVDALPRTALGKVRKREVIALLGADAPRSPS